MSLEVLGYILLGAVLPYVLFAIWLLMRMVWFYITDWAFWRCAFPGCQPTEEEFEKFKENCIKAIPETKFYRKGRFVFARAPRNVRRDEFAVIVVKKEK